MSKIRPAQKSLVSAGKIAFGSFDGPFARVNALDAKMSPPWPRGLKNMRLKEWQAFQFGSPDVFVNVALFNAKVLALAQVKVYDRRTKQRLLFEKKLPPWKLKLPDNVLDSECSYRTRDYALTFRNRLDRNELLIQLDIDAGREHPRILGTVRADTRGQAPLVVSIPFDEQRGMYSHKALAPISGHLMLGDDEIKFDPGSSYLLMDDHKGFYPYAMEWDWIAAGGFQSDNTLVGVNLTHNQSMDPERYNENCLWLDGSCYRLPAIRIEQRSPELRCVRDAGSRVDLEFEIESESRLDINALIMRSKYRAPFGRLSGTLRPEDGPETRIEQLFGMGEDFYLRC